MAQLQDIEEMLDRMVTDTELLSDSGALAWGHSLFSHSILWPLCVAASRAMRGGDRRGSEPPAALRLVGVCLAVGLRSAQPWRMLGFFFENIRHHLRIVDIGTTIDTLNRAKGACPAPSIPTTPLRARSTLSPTAVLDHRCMAACLADRPSVTSNLTAPHFVDISRRLENLGKLFDGECPGSLQSRIVVASHSRALHSLCSRACLAFPC